MKLNKNQFALIFQLLQKQPWLSDKSDCLDELMEMCVHLDEQQLVCALLDRFKYLSSQELSQHLNQMAEQIIKVWALPEDQTIILATAHDHKPDSSQMVLQMLKPILVKHGWSKATLVNRCDRVAKYIVEHSIVVLVDEFAGTGDTVCGRLGTIHRCCADKKVQACKVKVCLVACMEEAKSRIEREGVEVYAPLVQKKGITDHYMGSELIGAIDRMRRLESLLGQTVNGKSLPSFGHGGAEALYGTELSNVPNNVFPLFWWPQMEDGRRRNALFTRSDA